MAHNYYNLIVQSHVILLRVLYFMKRSLPNILHNVVTTLAEEIAVFFTSQLRKNGKSRVHQNLHVVSSNSKVQPYGIRMIHDQKFSLYRRFFTNWERVRIPRPPSSMISKLR